MNDLRQLDAAEIRDTLEQLIKRIEDRFPGSGLSRIAHTLLAVAREAPERRAWLERPILWARGATGLLVAGAAALLLWTVLRLPWRGEAWSVAELVQAIEAATSELLLLAAGLIFLFSFERRLKRRRVLAWLHELRALAHIVDLHQLAKDPERLAPHYRSADSSPDAVLPPLLLERYLDYASELLSLTGKIAASYAQRFDDGVVLAAVTEVENLSTALSAKIWQKILVLHTIQGANRGEPVTATAIPR